MKLQTAIDEFLEVARFSHIGAKRATVTLSLFLVLAGDVEIEELEPGFLNRILDDEAKKNQRTLHFFLSWCVRQGYLKVLIGGRPWRFRYRRGSTHSLFLTQPPPGFWRLS